MRRHHLLRLRADDKTMACVIEFNECTAESCGLDHVLIETAADQKQTDILENPGGLGYFTNREIINELQARFEFGHTDPNYKTVTGM